jgi:hypothetical protein
MAHRKRNNKKTTDEDIPRVRAYHNSVAIGGINISGDLSGEVNTAGRDIYRGYTVEQVTQSIAQIKTKIQPKPFDVRCPYKGLEVLRKRMPSSSLGESSWSKN